MTPADRALALERARELLAEAGPQKDGEDFNDARFRRALALQRMGKNAEQALAAFVELVEAVDVLQLGVGRAEEIVDAALCAAEPVLAALLAQSKSPS